MKKQFLSWGLILSLLLTMLPAPAIAAENEVDGDGLLVTESTQCTCEAQPDEAGNITHAEDCPLYTEPKTEEPAPETEEPAPETEETSAEVLTAPALTCEPLDEWSSSDMVLTVTGEWDSYAWEACSYGLWSPWEGDGPSLTLSKEDFTSYGFRCTVTRGEQSVTSEVFAYDPSVLEQPAMMANGLSSGTLEAASEYIRYYKSSRYHTRFDIQGVDNGTEFKTTYGYGGYRTAISVDGGAKVEIPYQSAAASVGSSLTAQTKLDIVNGDRYVKITYSVTNNGSTTQNFQIGSSADVMIDNNDRAEVAGVFSGDRCTGLSMDGNPKNSYQFSLVAPDCDTLWYGFYSMAYNNIFTNLGDKSQGYNGDSGMAWSWSGTVAPGQTWSRYVLIGAGELPAAPSAPVLDGEQFTLYADRTATITGTVTASGEQPAPTTVYVSIGGREYSADVENGRFSVEVEVPADMTAGSSSFTYWGTTVDGGISEIKTQAVTMVTAPIISLTTDSATVMEGDTVNLNSYISDRNGDVTISPENINTSVLGATTVTYTASIDGYDSVTATLTVTVLPHPTELTVTTVTGDDTDFSLSATMKYTGNLTYEETGFVYGALQNPTLTLNDGAVKTTDTVNTKDGTLSAKLSKDDLVYGVTYYARAYAKTADGTVFYGGQSEGFGVGNPQYGSFSVECTGTSNNMTTFTITRSGGSDGAQTVYYRTVNGSAVGRTHFEHKYGILEFKDGDSASQTVTVTEYGVTSIYGSNAATAYSNADRTYSLEIYRVTGGADIGTGTATRTMDMNDEYDINRSVYETETSRTVSTSNNNNYVADRSDSKDQDIFFTNNRGNNTSYPYTVGNTTYYYNFNVQRPMDVGTDLENAYLKDTATGFLYRATFTYQENNDCYHHVWVADHAPNNLNGSYNISGPLPLTTNVFGTAIYTARWETNGTDGKSGTLSLPSGTPGGDAHSVSSNKESSKIIDNNNYFLFDINDTAHLWFSATGEKEDRWHMTSYTDYLKVRDTEEPQLLGVAPIAGGSYLPGDSVTVALVFDEIVDSANSSLNNVSIETTWGTFNYVGGADTNVLYFTGTVSQDATGSLTVNSIINAGNIKDMADDTGTNTDGTVSNGTTDAALGTEGANAPTVTVSTITNDNGTLTGTITATNAGKLEYAWSTKSNKEDVVSWKLLASTEGDTVSTRQTSGTWYLHARATNSDGVSAYASQSVDLGTEGSGTVQLPSLTVSVNNAAWAKTRDITVIWTPDNATVTVKTPGGKTETVSGSTYTAYQNGVYTFTLKSGDDTVIQTVPVSKLDTTGPAVTFDSLNNTHPYTEPVTLTVRVSDGESGIQTVTGTWSSGTTNDTKTLSGENGVYTATSPDASGDWTLTVTATDAVGNTGTGVSSAYTINADRPGLTVTKQSESATGVFYSYTVTDNGNTGITVTLPDGSTTTSLTGTFIITEPGDYLIAVTDDAGHFVSEAITVDAPESGTLDGVAPDVRLSIESEAWTKSPVTVTVSVYDAGSTGKSLTANKDGQTITLTESTQEPGSFTGSFEVSANITYTVTCTDSAGNTGSGGIEITNIDTAEPTLSVTGGSPSAQSLALTVAATDDQSGVDTVTVTDPEQQTVTVTNGQVTVNQSGTYTVTATDQVGNKATQSITVHSVIFQNDGTQYASHLVVDRGKVTVPTVPSKIGYTFNGWYTEQTSGTKWDFNDVVTGNLTLYARWTANSYTVTFEKNAADAAGTMSAQAFTYDQSQSLTQNAFTRPGYTFAGWNTAPAGNGVKYDDQAEVENLSATDGDIITLYAQWTLKAPTVTLEASQTEATYGEKITLTAQVDHDASGLQYDYVWYNGNKAISGASGETLTLSDVADSGSYSVQVTITGDGSQEVTQTSGTENISISPRKAELEWNYTGPFSYTGNLYTVTATVKNPVEGDNFTPTYSGNQQTDVGSYQAQVTGLGNPNYTLAGGTNTTLAWEIVKGQGEASVTMEDWTYGEAASQPSPTSSTNGTGSMTYHYTGTTAGNQDYNSDAMPTDAGTYTVTATFPATANYMETTATAEFTIAPRLVELTWSGATDIPYDGQAHTVTATVQNVVGSDVLTLAYTDNVQTDSGMYTAQVIDVGNPNYTLEGCKNTTLAWQITPVNGTASVTMAGWTYGDTPKAPVPVSDTNTGGVTYHYTGRNGTDYNSDAVPTDAGDYTVTATFAATTNYQEVDAMADFTIGKKTITATWSGLTQVYDAPEPVTATLSGIVDGDDVSVQVGGDEQTAAGTYPLTATLTGDDAPNYTLKNHEATLTIQKKPVVITVTNNATTTEEVTPPTINAPDDLGVDDYKVLYKDEDGNEVPNPTEPGSYEVWVEFTDPNYRHPDGSLEAPVGSFTIAGTMPTLYTVTFAGGEGVTGDTASLKAVGGTILTLPECGFDKADARFTGWSYGGKTYQPGDRFTMPSQAVTFTAQWQQTYGITVTVTEKTEGGTTPAVANAVVSLWLGATKIAETTATDGTCTFTDLLPGIYNLVVTKDVRTVTSKVELTENQTCNAVLPKGATNSIVHVTEGSPDIVVGNLDKVFQQESYDAVYTEDDQTTVDEGGKVEITFTAEEKQQGDTSIDSDMTMIAEEADDAVTVGLVMDYRITKSVTKDQTTTTTNIPQSNVLLEILLPLPAQLQGKASYSIYRVHSSTGNEDDKEVQQLGQGESNKNGDGEYFTVSDDKTVLVLHVKNFSTYAIGYTESSENSSNNNNQTSSGGGSASPTYAPTVVQPEHGTVTVSPKSPQKGSTVTITATPDDGYTADTVTVTDAKGQPVTVTPNGDGTYTFVQPTGKVTITVTFRQISEASDCPRDESCPMAAFTDADRSAWYHDGVHYCVEHGLMVGTSQTTFAPNIPITRGMIVTILWRLEGSPMVDAPLDYDDVKPEDWYGEAVRWADSAGVVTGYGNGKFGPNDTITREQMAAMLWRYAGSPTVEGSLSSFMDGAQTSDWAQSAMIWAVEQGLIAGVGNGRLEPRGQATRAQAATILMRFAQDMAQ